MPPASKEKGEGWAVFTHDTRQMGAVGLAFLDSLAESSEKIIDVNSGEDILQMEEYLNNRGNVKRGALMCPWPRTRSCVAWR
jgi:hypothetical protein